MFWHEKIDQLKKGISPGDFRDPYTDGLDILKRIHDKFLTTGELDYNAGFVNWTSGLKDKIELRELPFANLGLELAKLDHAQNYWVVLVSTRLDSLVYEAKPGVIHTLATLWKESFYIGDKKYNWLVQFKRVPQGLGIFVSGGMATPWNTAVA